MRFTHTLSTCACMSKNTHVPQNNLSFVRKQCEYILAFPETLVRRC